MRIKLLIPLAAVVALSSLSVQGAGSRTGAALPEEGDRREEGRGAAGPRRDRRDRRAAEHGLRAVRRRPRAAPGAAQEPRRRRRSRSRRPRRATQRAEKRAAKLLVWMYTQSHGTSLDVILGARSLVELLRLSDAEHELSLQAATIATQTAAAKHNLQVAVHKLDRDRKAAAATVKELATGAPQIVSGLAERRKLLASVQNEVRKLEARGARPPGAARRDRARPARGRARGAPEGGGEGGGEGARRAALAAQQAKAQAAATTTTATTTTTTSDDDHDDDQTTTATTTDADDDDDGRDRRRPRPRRRSSRRHRPRSRPRRRRPRSPPSRPSRRRSSRPAIRRPRRSRSPTSASRTSGAARRRAASTARASSATSTTSSASRSPTSPPRSGTTACPWPCHSCSPGDLVFFDALDHVGIYLGNGLFVDAPHTGAFVRIDSLQEKWYAKKYVGARRI